MKLTFVIFILSIHCLQCGLCFGQKKQIDSLVQVLNTLSDTSRVDCLNELARLHIVTSHKSHGKPDTAWHYLDQAASEATRINYFRGIALTLQRRAWIERILLSNFPKAEEYGKQSLYWYTKTPNKEGLCYSLVETGQVIFSQSRYDEAIRFLLESFECFRKENDPAMIWPLSLTGQVYREKGEYNNAFDVFRQCLQIASHKNEKGHLDIIIAAEEDHLLVKILDDGVGRRRATELTAALPAQHKSMGLKITANRIAMLKEPTAGLSAVTIIDLVHPGGEPAGTEVNLRLPLIEN